MKNYSSIRSRTVVLFTLVIFLVPVALTWGNYIFAQENPGGTDFLVHWEGARAFLFEGISPYSDTVALRIQTATYGRPAQPGEHELRVAYPFYSVLVFAPFALINDYVLARSIWMTFLELSLLVMTFLSLNLARWKPKLTAVGLLFAFSLLWYHGVRPVINGNAVAFVALLIVSSLLLIRDKQDVAAGFLLALSTIKPHLVLLFIIYIFIWAYSQKRWRIIVSTAGFVLGFTLLGMVFIPDWILQNIWEILRYRSYNPPGTVGDVFIKWLPGVGKQLSIGFSIVCIVWLLWEWKAAWRKEFPAFLWGASFTLVLSQWIGIQTDPGNFIILFFPLVLILAIWDKRWRRWGFWIGVFTLITLLIGLWILFLDTIEYGYQPQQHEIMFFPLPLFLLVGLYWIRWWVVHPTRSMLLDEIGL